MVHRKELIVRSWVVVHRLSATKGALEVLSETTSYFCFLDQRYLFW